MLHCNFVRVLIAVAIWLVATPATIYGASLYVGSGFSNQVYRLDAATGESFGAFTSGGGLDAPRAMAFGPDGNFYVASSGSDAILRFSGATGEFIDVFASGGGLDGPTGIAFGPNNSLIVCSTYNDRILRYDASSGVYLGEFAAGGALHYPQGISFGPDGNLYVLNLQSRDVLRFDGETGAAMGTFASHTSLGGGRSLVFSPKGDLYVSTGPLSWVARFDGATGQFEKHYHGRADLTSTGIAFDDDGYFFVSENGSLREGVSRVDSATGVYEYNFAVVRWPGDILFGPDPVPEPGSAGLAAMCAAAFGLHRREIRRI